MAKLPHQSPERLDAGLQEILEDLAQSYALPIRGSFYPSMLSRFVTALSKKGPVVVLVDEYDSPIINNLKSPEVAEQTILLMPL